MMPVQRELARQAIGLPNKKKRSHHNRFVAGVGHPDRPYWLEMCLLGFAERRSDLFYLTPAGAEAVLRLDETLCLKDFPAPSFPITGSA